MMHPMDRRERRRLNEEKKIQQKERADKVRRKLRKTELQTEEVENELRRYKDGTHIPEELAPDDGTGGGREAAPAEVRLAQ